MVPRIENLRVVVDGVDARAILPSKETGTDEQPLNQLWTGEDSFHGSEESGASEATLVGDSSLDTAKFFDEVGCIFREFTEIAKILKRLSVAVAGHQPTRRLRKEECPNKKKTPGLETRKLVLWQGRYTWMTYNELDSKCNEPLAVTRPNVLDNSVVDPETYGMSRHVAN